MRIDVPHNNMIVTKDNLAANVALVISGFCEVFNLALKMLQLVFFLAVPVESPVRKMRLTTNGTLEKTAVANISCHLMVR